MEITDGDSSVMWTIVLCNCNWRICSAPPTISPMSHYTVKLSCLRRSINGRKQIDVA